MLKVQAALKRVKEGPAELIEPSHIEEVCREIGHRWRRKGPLQPPVVVLACIWQTLCGNASCRRVRLKLGDVSRQAFAQARQRLPLQLLRRLNQQLVARCNGNESGRWHGLRVYAADGTGVSMPDVPELAREFTYPANQKPGQGFPCAHLLHLFDFTTGMVQQTHVGPRATNDLKGLPQVLADLERDAVLVADRAFGCFLSLALCQQHGIHGVFRPQGGVRISFKKRRHAGKGRGKRPTGKLVRKFSRWDQLVTYTRPKKPSPVLDPEQFFQLPETITVREIHFRCHRKGFRPHEITLMTTLLDPDQYPAKDIEQLYMRRWQAEVNIRHLKQTLGLDVLKGKSVDVIHKEIELHVMAYNLVRLAMLESAARQHCSPDRVSFRDALEWMLDNQDPACLDNLLLNKPRPGRVHPRACKRRPKPHSLMTEPRHAFQTRISGQAGTPPPLTTAD